MADIVDLVGADRAGVQLINTTSPDGKLWAFGKFSENAHCGYVLKRRSKNGSHRLRISIITGLQKYRDYKINTIGAVILGEAPPGNLFSGEKSVSIAIESEISIIQLYLETTNAKGETLRFVTAVPAHLLRRGYHALPLEAKSASGTQLQDSVVCLLEKEESSGD